MKRLPRGAAVLIAVMPLCACKEKPSNESGPGGMAPMDRVQPVEVMKIETRTLEETVGLIGSIAANESAEVRAEIPGMITEICFEEGQAVRRGDVLLRVDTREVEAQLAEAAASFRLAEQNLARSRALLADAAVSAVEVDAATAEHERLRAMMDLLETRIAKSTLKAAFDGVTGARSVSVGDYVTSQDVITTLDDLGSLKVEMEVPERDLPGLRPGSPFTLQPAETGEGGGERGEVYFISSRIDARTRSSLVKGRLLNPPAHLKPGMFARIRLVLRTVDGALVVPEAALLSSPRGTALVIPRPKDGGFIADFVPVRTGIRIPGWVQVTPVGPPLQAGDTIVSSGVGGLILFPGVKVQPVDPVVRPEMPAETDRMLK